MEQKDLIYKENPADNFRKQCFLSQKGQELYEYHENCDTKVFGETLRMLEELCTSDEIDICFSVLEKYVKTRQKKHDSKK